MKKMTLSKKASGRISESLASGFVVVALLAQFFIPLAGQAAVQPASNPSLSQSCGLDIALVLDNSSSIDSNELTQMKSAFNDFVTTLSVTPADFSVTKFNTTASVVQSFSSNAATVNAAINSVTTTTNGSTNWQDGLVKTLGTFDPRVDVPNIIVFASDGNPNKYGNPAQGPGNGFNQASLDAAVTEANTIKAGGTRIVTLGIGGTTGSDALNPDNLKAISSADAYYNANDFVDLAATLQTLATDMCGGTITVQKIIDQDGDLQTEDVPPVPGIGWSFDVAGSSQTTDDNGYTQSVNVKTKQGPFSVTETADPDFNFLTAFCSGSTLSSGSLSGTTISGIGVGNGDIVSCVFINSPISTPIISYALNASIAGAGSGTVSSNPGNINCSSGVCSDNFNQGVSVALTATPDNGSTFDGWSGDCNGNGICQVTMDAIKNITATFNLAQGGTTSSADLSLTKEADNNEPAPLDTVIYSLTVNNAGPDTATNVVVTDSLPAGLTFVSANATLGTYDNATHLWSVGTLVNGASALLEITTTVQSDASGQIDNSASVISDINADPTLSNISSITVSTPTTSPTPTPEPSTTPTPSPSPSPSESPVVTSGGGGGGSNGPILASDAYVNWLAQQAAAQIPGSGQVAGATTEQPTPSATPTPQGEVKGESTFLPPTGFDLIEGLMLVALLLIMSVSVLIAGKQLNLRKLAIRK